MRELTFLLIVSLLCVVPAAGQSPNATINGIVLDPSGAAITGAQVVVVNDATGAQYSTRTNGEGIYVVPNLPPGLYRVQVSNSGFKTIIKPDIVIHVQDALAINFTLPIGAASEIVTVQGGAPLLNTESAAVSTVIDRQFVDNLPLNGRSFNTLLQLTPGVVIVPSSPDASPGQFSINGQRSNANSFQVDGVSANFASGKESQEQLAGGAQALNAYGGTSSLVSVDAMQEFRIVTSTFAPEYGRTPGGQVNIVTRSGTNQFHGTAFDYFRNDVLDANDWFINRAGKPRPPERQNDFGGVLGGPIFRDKTFFFLSYEGLRLRQPQGAVNQVPTVAVRNSAVPAAQPILNAFPLPDDKNATGSLAPFTASFSNRATMDAASIRVDQNIGLRLRLFGRYNGSPSQTSAFTPNFVNILDALKLDTTTVTLGATAQISTRWTDSFRFNYSRQQESRDFQGTTIGGAKPLSESVLFPPGTSAKTGEGFFATFDGLLALLGSASRNRTWQWNVVDDLVFVKGTHQLKFGADYRRLLLDYRGQIFEPGYFATSIQSFASNGTADFFEGFAVHPSTTLFGAFSAYAQDQWSIGQRITLTYGVRWELNPAPSRKDGTSLLAWQNTENPAQISLAPAGTPIWNTTYRNFAPRVGVAYKVRSKGDLVVRGGWGIFYDLGTGISSELASVYPTGADSGFLTGPFPLPIPDPAVVPPTGSVHLAYGPGTILGFSRDLELPRSYQWNVAVEKSLWGRQSLSLTYLGQAGRRLLRADELFNPNSNFSGARFLLTHNGDASDYNALQIQFRRPMARHVQALLNYTWSHSIDTASLDTQLSVPGTISAISNDRGSSDFDVRHAVTGALAYDVPEMHGNRILTALGNGWSLQLVASARTGLPVQITTSGIPGLTTRPDLVSGQPIWLFGSQYPGGKSLNPSAFAVPATARQGTLPRNSIVGFGFGQLDTSLARKFNFTDRIGLVWKVDAFNILNHPNFSSFAPFGLNFFGSRSSLNFSQSSQLVNRGLGGLNALYQMGGPRSLQLSLKLIL
ncbi:MAG TPA: TonB-dependent receptor [Candidatus Acidoferrum sp.]|nr:TonB-dependent receptor [Candidatus Acidoferrum sp.]